LHFREILHSSWMKMENENPNAGNDDSRDSSGLWNQEPRWHPPTGVFERRLGV